MTHSIGQILAPDGTPLCKMWLVELSPRSRDFLPHRHRDVELSCVLDGHGIYSVQDKQYVMSKNCGFMFCSQEIHCITAVDRDLVLLNLQFLPELLENRLTDSSGHDYKGMLYAHDDEFQNLFSSETIVRALNEIHDAFLSDESDLLIICKINELLARIIKERALRQAPGDYAQKIIAYINRNFRQPISVEQLAEIVGITPNHLSKVFKDACGVTVIEYLSLTRINYAKKLLTQTFENIIDVAMDSGYNNTANFNKAFKKYTAMTPKQYRSLAKQKINVDI